MTVEEWKKRCAARYATIANITPEHAAELADACFDSLDENPESCADDDMSCWGSYEG